MCRVVLHAGASERAPCQPVSGPSAVSSSVCAYGMTLVAPAVLLSLIVPGWRKAVPIAAVATAAAVVAVLILAVQVWHLNRWPSSPAVAATHQNAAGTGHDPAPLAPTSGPVSNW